MEKIEEKFLQGNLEFAFSIFKTLNEEEPQNNILISPFSISQVLTMAYNGAETTAKEAMEKVMGYSELERSAVNESFRNLNNYLNSIDNKIELKTGNSLWIKKGYTINEEFIRTNQAYFNASVENLDFTDPTATDIINDWIKEATKGKINKMLKPPIADDTTMFIINAVYFKGEWDKKFNPQLTYKGDFTSPDGSIRKVDMMKRDVNAVEYTKNEEVQAVRLPYGDGKISLYIILPHKGLNINDYINNMDIIKWEGIKKTVQVINDIIFAIPKFKLEYGIKNLNDSLTKLGMGEAFDESADFSGIGDNLYISKILHKAVIEVNEEGSEAAAVTVGEIDKAGYSEPIKFIVDRPFVLIINDDVTDTILFMGKVISIGE